MGCVSGPSLPDRTCSRIFSSRPDLFLKSSAINSLFHAILSISDLDIRVASAWYILFFHHSPSRSPINPQPFRITLPHPVLLRWRLIGKY
jgi:hypothetical protein